MGPEIPEEVVDPVLEEGKYKINVGHLRCQTKGHGKERWGVYLMELLIARASMIEGTK
jgi:hypothetical protein